jgi:DNA-binding protein HU-beta
MNKAELVDVIAIELPGTTKKSVNQFLNALTKVISESVAEGEKITIVGFGTFEAAQVKERNGRNPKTNEPMLIPSSVKPKFTPGKEFKEKVLAASK